jgi:hypothetical protein
MARRAVATTIPCFSPLLIIFWISGFLIESVWLVSSFSTPVDFASTSSMLIQIAGEPIG